MSLFATQTIANHLINLTIAAASDHTVTPMVAAPSACQTEIDHFAWVGAHVITGFTKSLTQYPLLMSRKHVMIGYMQTNMFTLVQHTIGMHIPSGKAMKIWKTKERSSTWRRQVGRLGVVAMVISSPMLFWAGQTRLQVVAVPCIYNWRMPLMHV